jgi:hypothetical protein
MNKNSKKSARNESQRATSEIISIGDGYNEPCWMYPDRAGEKYHEDERKVPKLLDRLRELGIVQVVKTIGRVYFYPIRNTRPMILYDKNSEQNTKWEWVRPDHMFQTVNYLMWQRHLKPELALAFWGIFDCMLMPETDWGCYYLGLGDLAFDHVMKWLSEEK